MIAAPIHVLSLHVGDRFRFAADPRATVFEIVVGPDDRLWVLAEGGPLPKHVLDVGGAYVYPIDPEEPEHDEESS